MYFLAGQYVIIWLCAEANDQALTIQQLIRQSLPIYIIINAIPPLLKAFPELEPISGLIMLQPHFYFQPLTLGLEFRRECSFDAKAQIAESGKMGLERYLCAGTAGFCFVTGLLSLLQICR